MNWYLDEGMEHVTLLAQKLQNGDGEYIDRFLSKVYKKRLPTIIAEMKSLYPTRIVIFDEIMFCYKRKKLHSSILGILSQIDGIAKDVTNEHFFLSTTDEGGQQRPRASKKIRQVFPIGPLYFFAPIMSIPTISEKFDDDSNPEALNRHGIMHGGSINYGTETNFFKAISLLKYMSNLLMEFDFDRKLLNK